MQNKHAQRAQIEIGDYIVDWANKYANGITNAKLSVVMYFLYAGYSQKKVDVDDWDCQNCFNASFITYPEGPVEYYTKAKYAHFGGMKLRNRNSQGNIQNPIKHRYVTEFLVDNFDLLTKNYGLVQRYLKREDGPWFLTKLDPDALKVTSLHVATELKCIPGELIKQGEAHLFSDAGILDHAAFNDCIKWGSPVYSPVYQRQYDLDADLTQEL